MTACSFTGHRQIKNGHLAKMPEMLDRAINYVYSKGCRKFFAGGAIGFDTEAAKAVIRFRMTHPDASLVLLLPCENQSEHWSLRQRESYEYVLSSADEVIYVSEEYTPDCMKKRNMRLAEECDVLIAYAARARSGAAQTVRIAESLGRQVYNLYPALEKESL